MEPIITARCKQGKLIITEQHIRVQLFSLQSRTMVRSSLTGIDYKMLVPSVFGFGGGGNLVFHGMGGERLEAGMVQAKNVKKVMQLLGY